jgi:hypothetical protein
MPVRLSRIPAALVLLTTGCLCAGAVAQQPASLPDYPAQVMLIKNTVTAVNHGNITGNYTVLRDLASERFRQRNTAGDLANTFAVLRQQKLDLSPILVTEPQIIQRPGTDQHGRFHLVGFFPTRPQAVQFALVFQPVSGGWMIDEVTMGVKPIESLVQPQGSPQPASFNAPAEDPHTIKRPPYYPPPAERNR